MNFAVLTTTFRRPKPLGCAIKSVQNQNQHHIHIIVNDSPETDYSEIEEMIATDSSIIYIRNKQNVGKNTSLNRAFAYLKSINFDGYIIFLDDDDWLSDQCLADFETALQKHIDAWVVSRRSLENGTSLTVNKTVKTYLSYTRDCLLLRKFSGDATHCIRFQEASRCEFPTTIKNAEEWIFFAHLTRYIPYFRFVDKIGTLSNGYTPDGLNTSAPRASLRKVSYEILQRKVFSGYVGMYIAARAVKRVLQYLMRYANLSHTP